MTEPVLSDVQRHPWNRDFEWRDHTGPFHTLTEAQVRQFDEIGCVVVPDIVEPSLLAAVLDETDVYEAELETALRGVEGGRVAIAEADAITFTTHLVARSNLLRSLSAHPTVAGICADLVGPDLNLYWDQAVYKKPQKPRRFPWHQDNGYKFVEPQQYLTVWLALTDATATNGCPHIAPRLHRVGTLEHAYVEPLGFECFLEPPTRDAVVVEVPAGGAAVFSSLTPHLTGPNTSDSVRKAYILQYAPFGAEVLHGDPHAGPPTHRDPADAPERQYAVVRDGVRVEPPPLSG